MPRWSTPLLPVPTRASGWALLAFTLPTLFARHTDALDLRDLLAGVAANDRFETPIRADVRLTCEPACESAESRAIFLGKGETLYVEVQGGLRALVRPGEILTPEGGKAAAGDDPCGAAGRSPDLGCAHRPGARRVPWTPR